MARRSTKKFDFGKDIYYFNVKNGFNNVITIKRKNKNEAVYAYHSYKKSSKDCEWLGKWNGDKFIENTLEKSDA